VTEPTTIRVYPGADGTFTLYDDDGTSLGYRDGTDAKTVWTKFHWDDKARRLTIESDPRMKKWPGDLKTFAVEIIGRDAKPKQVQFRGERITVEL
jgi:Domain of unknown function (DUF5110)